MALLRSVLDRIIPADQYPGAVALGGDSYVVKQLSVESIALAEPIRLGLAKLDSFAAQKHGAAFHLLSALRQDELLSNAQDAAWFYALAELTAEGYYADPGNGGNDGARSWRMIGYQHGLPEGPCGPGRLQAEEPRANAQRSPSTERYDLIVVGAGAGGTIVAAIAAEAGKRVLLLERGRSRSYADSGHRDHLRNHRSPIHGHNTGPDLDGNPRVLVDPGGCERIMRPHEPGYHNNAACVGGGTFLYGGLAWRFLPDDFRMATVYGAPEGSSLVDWPIGYEDLEPWYGRAEREIGVSGDGRGGPHAPLRREDYPMPPVPQHKAAELLRRGAEKLGLATFAPPILINTVPYNGRPRCIECGSCVGFPCPSNGKNGTHNTMAPRALATGLCDLVTGAVVEKIDTDDRGRVTGVAYIDANESAATRRSVQTKAVVLACGAIETARLMLLSSSPMHPRGLGNGHDHVGRHLQGHYYPTVFGLFDEDVYDPRGPGVTIATCDYNHGNDGVIGGAALADDFIILPGSFWKGALPPDLPRWGQEAKEFMRRDYRRVLRLRAPVQEIPNPQCRVELDPRVRDKWGLPVARLSGAIHPETMRTALYIQERAKEWLAAAGATRTWALKLEHRLSAGQHQAGTCRMGTDAHHSVTDSYGRVWGHDNLFVSDASLHPTNGGFNPVLTIMALAFRNADDLVRSL